MNKIDKHGLDVLIYSKKVWEYFYREITNCPIAALLSGENWARYRPFVLKRETYVSALNTSKAWFFSTETASMSMTS